MAEVVPSEVSSEKSQHPLSQAGLSSLLIALSAILVPDDNVIVEKVVSLLAPVASYFVVREIQRRRKKNRLTKLCATIDQMISNLGEERADRLTSKSRKDQIDVEVGELRRMKNDHILADVDITLKK